MRAKRALVGAAVVAAMLPIGCSAPVVKVRHGLASALLLRPEESVFRAGEFSVESGPKEGSAAFVRQRLQEALSGLGQGGAGQGSVKRPGPEGPVDVTGTIRIRRSETRGSRQVRRLDAGTQGMKTEEVPTLVRKVDVTVAFILTRASGKRWIVAETRAEYSSVEDGRVRGQWGLDRADDPARVPAEAEVIRELLGRCVATFCGMVRPVEVTAEVRMRPSLDRDGAAGLKAAEKGRMRAAAEHFAAAVQRSPDDVNLLFNLAVASEARGDLPAALRHYKDVLARTSGGDAPAQAAVSRVERVIRVRGKVGK